MRRPRLIAIKESAKTEALALVSKGYDQISQVLECPLCSVRFLLLMNSVERLATGRSQDVSSAIERCRQLIVRDDKAGHPYDCLFLED